MVLKPHVEFQVKRFYWFFFVCLLCVVFSCGFLWLYFINVDIFFSLPQASTVADRSAITFTAVLVQLTSRLPCSVFKNESLGWKQHTSSQSHSSHTVPMHAGTSSCRNQHVQVCKLPEVWLRGKPSSAPDTQRHRLSLAVCHLTGTADLHTMLWLLPTSCLQDLRGLCGRSVHLFSLFSGTLFQGHTTASISIPLAHLAAWDCVYS